MMGVRGGVWAWSAGVVVVSSLLLVLLLPPTPTEAVPAPHFRRGGRFIAGALGFAGGFLVGRHVGWRRGGCGGCYGGCGGCHGGGGCGWCGGGYYGRKRRSIDEVMDAEHLEEFYRKVAGEDEDECGKRLVCELAQKDPNHLTAHETLLLLPYRGRDEINEGSYYGQYDKAVWHGQKGNPCHEIFSLCPYPAHVIIADAFHNDTLLQEWTT